MNENIMKADLQLKAPKVCTFYYINSYKKRVTTPVGLTQEKQCSIKHMSLDKNALIGQTCNFLFKFIGS